MYLPLERVLHVCSMKFVYRSNFNSRFRFCKVMLYINSKVLKSSVSVLILSGAFLIATVASFAAPGDLDTTFGVGGKVTLRLNDRANAFSKIAIQKDEKIIAVGTDGYGDIIVVRYNVNGTLDSTFANGGVFVYDAGNFAYSSGVAIQSDGKIIVACSVDNDVYAAFRLKPNGSLDNSFGENGWASTDFTPGRDTPQAIVIQPDDKIVITGSVYDRWMVESDIGLVRYNADGTPDMSFGEEGKIIKSIGTNSAERGYALKIQDDGKIIVFANSGVSESDTNYLALLRYLPNGTLDPSFDNDGISLTNLYGAHIQFGGDLEIQPDGKILVATTTIGDAAPNSLFMVARYFPDGSPDFAFGSSGRVDIVRNHWNVATSLAIQPDGKIIAAGESSVPGDASDILLARLNDDGSFDTTFGIEGKVFTDAGGIKRSDYCYDITLQRDGKIIVAGDNSSAAVLLRYIAGVHTPAPDKLDLQAQSDTGKSDDDNLTNSRAPAFNISGVSINAAVELLRGDIVVDRIIANSEVVTLRDNNPPGNGQVSYSSRQVINNQSSLRSSSLLVTYDTIIPVLTLNQDTFQRDPVNTQPVNFKLISSEEVVGFDVADVSLAGSTAGVSQAGVTVINNTNTNYQIQIRNILTDGIVRASVPAGVVMDAAGNNNQASVSTDNTVMFDSIAPTVSINQDVGQADPAKTLPIVFSLVFSEPVGMNSSNVISLDGSTANVSAAIVTVTGSGTSYKVSIRNVSSNGQTIQASVRAGVAQDLAGNLSLASTSSDNIVTLDNVEPTVTINQAAGQADPSTNQPINFTVIFSEPVTGFNASDISLTGSTANVSLASIIVTGSGTTYNVAVGNITSNGQLRAVVVANAAQDTIGNLSGASTSTDNIITYNGATTTQNRKTVGVFRPSNGITYMRNSNTGGFAEVSMIYGVNGDTSFAGDWNGDRVDSIGIYRNGVFYLRNSNTTGSADVVFAFGSQGDQPIAGDWNGDGIDTIGVYRPTTGVFMLRNSNTAGPPDVVFVLGNPGDVAIAGDWNGDGTTTTGVFRPTNGIVYLKNTNVSGDADIYLVYGVVGDKPLAGDWDGDGVDSIGIYRGGVFYLRNSNTQGNADLVFALGNPGDEPIAGDWDGLP
jgi:uncharacterized delta-60 repeat protein